VPSPASWRRPVTLSNIHVRQQPRMKPTPVWTGWRRPVAPDPPASLRWKPRWPSLPRPPATMEHSN